MRFFLFFILKHIPVSPFCLGFCVCFYGLGGPTPSKPEGMVLCMVILYVDSIFLVAFVAGWSWRCCWVGVLKLSIQWAPVRTAEMNAGQDVMGFYALQALWQDSWNRDGVWVWRSVGFLHRGCPGIIT